jgi:hypothetical protein
MAKRSSTQLQHADYEKERWLPKVGDRFEVTKIRPYKKYADGSFEPHRSRYGG